jgi:GT2 family glycosyltransferase
MSTTAANEYRPVSILIPAYGAAEKLSVCLDSLALHAPAGCAVYVLDDCSPDDTVCDTCISFQSRLPGLHYTRSERNRGFVGSCNWGWEHLIPDSNDLLLLNSDTKVTAGFLEEMQHVLNVHERHAVISPRSNNATIFSVPAYGATLPPAESYDLWVRLKSILPRYSVMPTAAGFCMLIRREILERFGLFDDIYSPGYNEENDFICRINRYGYSALAANWAYVFHYESSSFGERRTGLEHRNRAILLERYPEYRRNVYTHLEKYADPVEIFSALQVPHRPRLLFDITHLEPRHAGTSDFALNLLRALAPLLENDFDLHIALASQARDFFSSELAGYNIYEDRPSQTTFFDLVYKPCQMLQWSELKRMIRLGARIAFTLLDIIAMRCGYLGSFELAPLLRASAESADCIFAISEYSRTDFSAYYGEITPMRVIHLATNMWMVPDEPCKGESVILVMGNRFAHKGLSQALMNLDSRYPITVLGGQAGPESPRENIQWLESGNLSRQEIRDVFMNARVVVYPSHYEGFGLPVLDAITLGKPVIVLDNQINRELEQVAGAQNLYRIRTMRDLQATIDLILDSSRERPRVVPRRWSDTASEYAASFREILAKEIDAAKLRARWQLLRSLGLDQSLG